MVMKNRFFKIVVCLIILIVAFIGVDVFMSRAVDRNNGKGILINIPAGSSTSAIANTLYKKGTIRSKFFFRLNSKVLGYSGKYHAGSYLVKKSMSMKEQMDLIKSGKIAGKVFTVADGNNMFKTLNAMEKAKVINKTDFYNEIENGKFNYEFIKELPKGKNRLEGFLYPDTYNAPADATPHQVIDMMLKNFDRVFKREYYEKIKERKKSLMEIITIASIVEREAKTKEDKKKVASVIYNRLKAGMPLQMDSILAYITGEEKIKASLKDTQVDSKYNPYKNKGLPPGPICSPGKDSIEAAINPDETEYLYFVASDKLDGTNVFSKTYEEFLKDKAKFDKAYAEYRKKNPDKK